MSAESHFAEDGQEDAAGGVSGGPVVILVRPQMGQNIGAAARAMLNCGLSRMRLVAPRDGWPNPDAVATASGASAVIDNVQVFETVADAVADLQLVYATTGRAHDLNIPIERAEEAAQAMHQAEAGGIQTGVLFGSERAGLEGADVVHANRVLTIPLNPEFKSLNLAQAVLLVCYQWYQAGGVPEIDNARRTRKTRPATQAELEGLMQHLTDELDSADFFTSPEKRPSMLRNLRAAFVRMDLTQQDVLTFRGVIKALVLGRRG